MLNGAGHKAVSEITASDRLRSEVSSKSESIALAYPRKD